jgi:hypothetical protein
VVGRYNADNDDLSYSLLDSRDPSRGVSILYPSGEKCSTGALRTTTLDVQCANTASRILSAQEPHECQYHFAMESYHGCPTECPVTKGGLCNSHGHCAFDDVLKVPYCYCNEGYTGASCTSSSSSNSGSGESFDGESLQLRLVTALVVLTGLLGAVIGFMIFKVITLRKEQAEQSSVQFAQRSKLIQNNSRDHSSNF